MEQRSRQALVIATTEIYRFEDRLLKELSPAAQLARQHTLSINAEAAVRQLKDQQEAANAPTNGVVDVGGVPSTAWEKDTASRAGGLPHLGNVIEGERWAPDRILSAKIGRAGEGGYDPIGHYRATFKGLF